MYIFNFKNYYLICMMIVLSSCIGTNYNTHLVDKNQSEDIVFFDTDSTIISLSGHMKEWNKYLGVINIEDSVNNSDYLKLYIQVENDCQPITVERFAIKIELLKEGELIYLENGYIYWADDIYMQSNPVSLSDSLKNNNYPSVTTYCDPYLYTIISKDKQLIDCDTLIVKPDIKFTVNDNQYHIQRTDTLYRTVEKSFRLISY